MPKTDHMRKIESAEVSARLMRPRVGARHRKWHRGSLLARVCRTTGVSPAWLLTGSYHLEPPSISPLAA